MSLRPRATAPAAPAAVPQSSRLRFVLSTGSKFLQPPSTDVKRTIKEILKQYDPADLMANAFDVYEWLKDEIVELELETDDGEPSYGRASAEDIYDASAAEMLTWFRRVKLAMENIGVYGPGTTKDDDDEEDEEEEENIRSLVSKDSDGVQLRRLIQAKWMASDDGFRYPPLNFPKGSADDEERFFDWLSDRRSLNKPIVEAMGL